jgi:choline dehydrogenase
MAFADGLTPPDWTSFTGTVSLLEPSSRGTVRLRSTDPTHSPLIALGLYTRADDFTSLLDGARVFIEMTASGPLGPYLETMFFPACSGSTSSQFAAAARTCTQTMYHPVGTCAIGEGQESVVDHMLRVHGIDGIRVADASVMPVIPHGNTNASTIMIAEKAADLVCGVSTAP